MPQVIRVLRNTEYSIPALLALETRLVIAKSVHGEPGTGYQFVQRPNEAETFVQSVLQTHANMQACGKLDKSDSPLLEYATMSGAGKSRWGFEVERLLRRACNNASVGRVGLNFNGGTGGGSADKSTAEEWSGTDHKMGLDRVMAALLLARGLLQCSPEDLRGAERWLEKLPCDMVIDALFTKMPNAEGNKSKILVVHVDELALLTLPGAELFCLSPPGFLGS